jgi:integrase
VVPWTHQQVAAVRAALPERYRPLVDLPAGCGLRQGELFGLAVDDVDFLRGVVHVRRQVKIICSRPVFALPKGGKVRDVPLPESLALRLSRHLATFPARAVSLPWRIPDGAETMARLLVTSREDRALNRNYVKGHVWKPALDAACVPPTRENGMHALRHWFASVLLDGGVSIKALADHLGHADPGFTLRVYTHLMPAVDDRTRTAVDRALTEASRARPTDRRRTGGSDEQHSCRSAPYFA